jgi:hypothetical protein
MKVKEGNRFRERSRVMNTQRMVEGQVQRLREHKSAKEFRFLTLESLLNKKVSKNFLTLTNKFLKFLKVIRLKTLLEII